MLLKPIDATGYTRKKKWCVPSAISTLTGLPLSVTTARCAHADGTAYSEVSGVLLSDALLVLAGLGWRHKAVDLPARFPTLKQGPTLTRYMHTRSLEEIAMPILLSTGYHAFAGHGYFLSGNDTMYPVGWESFPKLGRKVCEVCVLYPPVTK